MPQSISQLHTHIIFSTKLRQPFIDDYLAQDLFRYLGGICNKMGCPSIAVGGHVDHVHILFALSRTKAVATLVEKVKSHSSKWAKTRGEAYQDFYWQDGYAAFSVNPAQTHHVVKYIARQKQHHATQSFQDESRMFFRRYGCQWDERYCWD